jgi:hypothetical protein
MAKQQTKKDRLEDLFRQARLDLPRELFIGWLCFCFGIFEHRAGTNERINRMDVTLAAKELADLREKVGYAPKCQLSGCGRPAMEKMEYCSLHHSLLDLVRIDGEVMEQGIQMEGE